MPKFNTALESWLLHKVVIPLLILAALYLLFESTYQRHRCGKTCAANNHESFRYIPKGKRCYCVSDTNEKIEITL